MMCVGHRQRGNAPAAAMPAPAIPVMGLPGGPQARPMPRPGAPPALSNPTCTACNPTHHNLQPQTPHPATPSVPGTGPAIPVTAVRASGVYNPAPPPPPPRQNFPPPPPRPASPPGVAPGGNSGGGGGAAAQLAQAQEEMQLAAACGDFERCITLREKVKSLKLVLEG